MAQKPVNPKSASAAASQTKAPVKDPKTTAVKDPKAAAKAPTTAPKAPTIVAKDLKSASTAPTATTKDNSSKAEGVNKGKKQEMSEKALQVDKLRQQIKLQNNANAANLRNCRLCTFAALLLAILLGV